MYCQICSIEVTMPYNCPHCGGQFCSQHRLPENHVCPQINRAHTQRQTTVGETRTQTGSRGYNYSFNFNPQPIRTHRNKIFSIKELTHITIAALLVIGIGISILIDFPRGLFDISHINKNLMYIAGVFSVCTMASFLAHEFAHKITAQKHGLLAEFRLITSGALFTLMSMFLPLKVIAPGAMMISGTANKETILKISIAGPITNIIFAIAFFTTTAILPLNSLLNIAFALAGCINAFMAVFNLIPIGFLDGYKIFSVNKTVWITMFIPSLILAIYGYLIM